MSEESFWADARPVKRGWMARGDQARARFDAAHQPPPPEPEPQPDAVAGLDLQQYAAQRAALGVRSASEFVGLNRDSSSGFPNADTRMNREQLAASGIPVPPEATMHSAGRELDQDYQKAQHSAAQHTSVGAAPITSRTIRAINENT